MGQPYCFILGFPMSSSSCPCLGPHFTCLCTVWALLSCCTAIGRRSPPGSATGQSGMPPQGPEDTQAVHVQPEEQDDHSSPGAADVVPTVPPPIAEGDYDLAAGPFAAGPGGVPADPQPTAKPTTLGARFRSFTYTNVPLVASVAVSRGHVWLVWHSEGRCSHYIIYVHAGGFD